MDRLPIQLTKFIGREQELAAIRGLLQETRLLTLTGPGGCGKTRLALQSVMGLVGHFSAGIGWVELAALTEEAMLPQTILRSLTPNDQGEQSASTPLDSLIDYLGNKSLLLVIDNCEHLIAGCAQIGEALLRACPALHILATSRESLGIGGERVWLVPSLTTPPLHKSEAQALSMAELLHYDAGRLFVERAQAVKHDFRVTAQNAQAIAQICQRVDGIPLAIELAAARITLLSAEQIAAHLERSFQLLEVGSRSNLPRHRTIRATIEWSYALLSLPEQTLLRRLSVFSGVFSIEAVAFICVDPIEANSGVTPEDVLALLTRLIDKTLVSVKEESGVARYRLLEIVRQYFSQKLEQSQEKTWIEAKHLHWYLSLAERADADLAGADRGLWINRLESEYDNLRAALDWSLGHEDDPSLMEMHARLAIAMMSFWYFRGRASEGRVWLNRVLSRRHALSPALEVRALIAAGIMAWNHNDFVQAAALLEEGRTLGFALGTALFYPLYMAANFLGLIAYYQDNYALANTRFEEALALLRKLGDEAHIPFCLSLLGRVALRQGDYARALLFGEESLTLSRQLKNVHSISATLNLLGSVAYHQGDLDYATTLLAESLALSRELGFQQDIADTLAVVAAIELAQTELAKAERAVLESLTISRASGSKLGIAIASGLLGEVASALGQTERATELFRQSLTLLHTLGARWHLLQMLDSFAFFCLLQDAPQNLAELGVVILSAVHTLRVRIAIPRPPIRQPHYEQALAAASARLSPAAFTAAWAKGTTMDLVQTVALALQQNITSPLATKARPEQPRLAVTTAEGSLLRVYALGPAEIHRAGFLITNAEWGYAKPRELFFYLLCHPPRTREQIGLVLWPDASPAQLRSRLHMALHHLRKALGRPDWILYANGRYSFNHALGSWFDVTLFKTKLQEAHKTMGSTQPDAVLALEATLHLYRGDFLEEIEPQEWIMQRREELRALYLTGLLTLGQWHFAAGQYEAAAESFRRAIAQDPFMESAHRELMRSLAYLNASAHALRHYQAFVDLLRDELGALPAAETAELALALRRGQKV